MVSGAVGSAGLGDVITHQSGGRCCSDLFANALADALNVDGLMYLPDATGVYTDTAEFTGLVPECTNLSVGYAHQHGPQEELNLRHFLALASVVTQIDWEALPTTRDPKIRESCYNGYAGWGGKVPTFKDWPTVIGDEPHSPDIEVLAAMDAIGEALDRGYYQDLIAIMAETIYPDDPELARKHIRTQNITETMLLKALEDLDIYTVETVMLELYDQLPVTA